MTVLQERIFIIIIACLLDLVFGDPHWLWHPVQGMGWLIDHAETWMRKRFRIREERDADIRKKQAAGTFTVVIVVTVSLLVAAGILYGCNRIHHTLYLVVAIWMSYQMLAACSLRRESMKVCKALEAGDVEQARTAVSMIVGRDTASLTEEGIAKAAVETVAENTSDGVIAPLFYMFLFGPVGAWVYKAINTMDSMLGYKNDQYRYFGYGYGWCGADSFAGSTKPCKPELCTDGIGVCGSSWIAACRKCILFWKAIRETNDWRCEKADRAEGYPPGKPVDVRNRSVDGDSGCRRADRMRIFHVVIITIIILTIE